MSMPYSSAPRRKVRNSPPAAAAARAASWRATCVASWIMFIAEVLVGSEGFPVVVARRRGGGGGGGGRGRGRHGGGTRGRLRRDRGTRRRRRLGRGHRTRRGHRHRRPGGLRGVELEG